MSCIPMVGKPPTCGGEDLPRSVPVWSQGKRRRLDRFAVSEDPWQRAVAAGHPKVPENRLLALLQDEVGHVRRCAVKNPVMTRPLFELAARDEDPGIAAYARVQLQGTC